MDSHYVLCRDPNSETEKYFVDIVKGTDEKHCSELTEERLPAITRVVVGYVSDTTHIDWKLFSKADQLTLGMHNTDYDCGQRFLDSMPEHITTVDITIYDPPTGKIKEQPKCTLVLPSQIKTFVLRCSFMNKASFGGFFDTGLNIGLKTLVVDYCYMTDITLHNLPPSLEELTLLRGGFYSKVASVIELSEEYFTRALVKDYSKVITVSPALKKISDGVINYIDDAPSEAKPE